MSRPASTLAPSAHAHSDQNRRLSGWLRRIPTAMETIAATDTTISAAPV